MPIKSSFDQYRNIAGKHFVCVSADTAQYAGLKRESRQKGLSYRIIDGQFYQEQPRT